MKIVFLCSGGGGNLRFTAEMIRIGLLAETKIQAIIIDRECPASGFAQSKDIPVYKYNFSEDNQQQVIEKLQELNPTVIVTNIHRILSSDLVKAFKGKLINLHYSILPAFNGLIGANTLTKALGYGAKIIGTTVHLVEDVLDIGPPLIQTATPVNHGDSPQFLMDILFRAGCISLLMGIQTIGKASWSIPHEKYQGLFDISGRMVLFNPPAVSVPEFQSELFWKRIRDI